MKRVVTLNKNGEEIITISMEEYRELLIIKGRYLELESKQAPIYTGIRFNETDLRSPTPYEPYKVTCGTYEGEK